MNRFALLSAIAMLCTAGMADAGQTVYQCNGVYTDQPCKGGREVDVTPTEGVDSVSGKKRQSAEATAREFKQRSDAAFTEGVRQGQSLITCASLQQERERIDRQGGSADRRFAIRQQQFELRCKQQ